MREEAILNYCFLRIDFRNNFWIRVEKIISRNLKRKIFVSRFGTRFFNLLSSFLTGQFCNLFVLKKRHRCEIQFIIYFCN